MADYSELFSDGDRVAGVPVTERTRKKFPVVVGHYKRGKIERTDFTIEFDQILVDEDVAIACTDIRPAEDGEEITVVM